MKRGGGRLRTLEWWGDLLRVFRLVNNEQRRVVNISVIDLTNSPVSVPRVRSATRGIERTRSRENPENGDCTCPMCWLKVKSCTGKNGRMVRTTIIISLISVMLGKI